MDKNATELDAGDNDSGEYEVEAIWDSAVYARESESGHLPGLYYLVSLERYPEEENTWEPASVVQHHRKLITSFHKDHSAKPTATFPAIDTAPTMAKPTKPLKRKQGRPTGRARRVKRGQRRGDTEEATRKNPSQCSFKSQKPAGSRRFVCLARGAPGSLHDS